MTSARDFQTPLDISTPKIARNLNQHPASTFLLVNESFSQFLVFVGGQCFRVFFKDKNDRANEVD